MLWRKTLLGWQLLRESSRLDDYVLGLGEDLLMNEIGPMTGVNNNVEGKITQDYALQWRSSCL